MSDIFISYSREDSARAEQLSEMLASAGLSVWIDRSSIEAATSWSASIVDAINECKAFIVMLSPSSIESHNVIKEVSLASEKRKKILPLDLEPVTLPRELEYQLAGIQRAPMTNIDSIIRALSKLGLEATGAPQAPKIVKESDERKSLMILPFEDLSPTGDNGWFADGIASELITALSHVRAIRIADAQATKEFKSYRGQLTAYAAAMSIRYFVQGDVRKFGDQIKISARLLDIDSGDHLWQESIKGTMADVFEIQEIVAKQVVDALHLILTDRETSKLAERGTVNTLAYELAIKARDYKNKQTKDAVEMGIRLASDAIDLDPQYAFAYYVKAWSYLYLYQWFDRTPERLIETERLTKRACELDPELPGPYFILTRIFRFQGREEDAQSAREQFKRVMPEQAVSYFNLGILHTDEESELQKRAYEKAMSLNPAHLGSRLNLINLLHRQNSDVRGPALESLAFFERHLVLLPNDHKERISYAAMLCFAERSEEAEAQVRFLLRSGLDDKYLLARIVWLATLFEPSVTLSVIAECVQRGYRDVNDLAGLRDVEWVKANPQYAQSVENIIASASGGDQHKNA